GQRNRSVDLRAGAFGRLHDLLGRPVQDFVVVALHADADPFTVLTGQFASPDLDSPAAHRLNIRISIGRGACQTCQEEARKNEDLGPFPITALAATARPCHRDAALCPSLLWSAAVLLFDQLAVFGESRQSRLLTSLVHICLVFDRARLPFAVDGRELSA